VNIELRPLRLGEILDRTFQLYRARFTLFLGIAAVSTILELLWSALQLGETSLLSRNHVGPAQQVITTVTVIAGWAFGFGCAALATAAINRAVLAIYEGKPVGIASAYGAVRGRWLTCVWANILAFFIAWSPVIVVALGAVMSVVLARSAKSLAQANAVTLVYGLAAIAAVFAVPLCVWLSLRYSLAIPACIQEGKGTLSSLKRSVLLSRESRGRIFLLLLVVGAAWSVLLMAFMIPTFALMAKNRGHMALGLTIYTLAVSFLCSTLMKPAYSIGLTLFYYDARIRKEGYDVEWMLEHSTQPETLVPPEPFAGPGSTPSGMISG
jgi:Membrane domain of glycerophosphoryl diester phosphodiesterase